MGKSPAGRWLAYLSLESGTAELYVVAYDRRRAGQMAQFSTNEGSLPQWGDQDQRQRTEVPAPHFYFFASAGDYAIGRAISQ